MNSRNRINNISRRTYYVNDVKYVQRSKGVKTELTLSISQLISSSLAQGMGKAYLTHDIMTQKALTLGDAGFLCMDFCIWIFEFHQKKLTC